MALLDFMGPFKWLLVLGAIGIGTGLIILVVLFFPSIIVTLPLMIILFGFVGMVFLGILGIDRKVKKNCIEINGKMECDI